ncbi:hypothetical protein [Paenibacillus whitsoniae]|uniref:Uncharacterized protein n=1 Tax=Paenibacillus whitsoniae TaxID=2496558 RepID=A0A430JEY5_9BACL|nr:hypothetical protein [Paenibacillus whitsoniae]RTE09603.1 hypothetical protein EJQ19_11415 [Paenibacillus whitsoniae]
MNINLGQREYLMEILNYEYIIPEEFHICVKDAIKKYATKNYTEESIDSILKKAQSMAASIGAIRHNNLSLFRGKFAEWLACIEYNALKNKGNVLMTIVNPDPTSKADLLHIIKKGDRYEAIPGPDIKCGGSTYVLDQWKKIVNSRYDIPMVDMDGVLTTEEGLKMLTKKQKNEFEQLKQMHPRKKPIKSEWNKQDINRLMMDYLKYICDGITPVDSDENPFVADKENRERIKDKLLNLPENAVLQSDWGEFSKKAFELPNIPENRLNSMTLAKLEQKKRNKETQERVRASTENKKNSNGVNTSSKPKQNGVMRRIANLLSYETPKEMFVDVAKTAVLLGLAIGVDALDRALGSGSDSNRISADRNDNVINYKDTNDVKNNNIESSRTINSTHASPNEHIVKGHGQRYNTKEGPIWREKAPFTRGKKD